MVVLNGKPASDDGYPSPTSTGPSVSGKSTTTASAEPPSYADATGPDGEFTPRKPPCNHIYITNQNSSVKGTWIIDPSLRIPPGMLPQVPEGTRRENMRLESHNGSVVGEVSLVGEGPDKALLEALSHNGSVKVIVSARAPEKKFRLRAHSHNGSVIVQIPRDFVGPITYENHNGSTTFSSAMEGGLTHFSRQNRIGRSFVGDWVTAGYGEDGPQSPSEWLGDELHLKTKNGSIKVMYVDDEEANCSKPFGWLAKLFGASEGRCEGRSNTGTSSPTSAPSSPSQKSPYMYPTKK